MYKSNVLHWTFSCHIKVKYNKINNGQNVQVKQLFNKKYMQMRNTYKCMQHYEPLGKCKLKP